MTRFRLRQFQGRAKSFVCALCFWFLLAAMQALGGAVTDQAPAAIAVDQR